MISCSLEADPGGVLTGRLRRRQRARSGEGDRLRAWLGGESVELWAYGDSSGDDELLARGRPPDPRPMSDASTVANAVERDERRDHGSRRWTDRRSPDRHCSPRLTAGLVNRNVFPYYSGDHDEPVYRYQAEMLEDGVLTIPRCQEQFFRPWLSGPQGDHLVLAFQPGWPAVLMVSQKATGSTLPALGLAAALAVLASYLVALELTRRRGIAAVSAMLVALAPFSFMLGGTHLNYIMGLGLGALVTGCLLRARRTGSAAWAVGAGVAFGALLLTRPLDAFLAVAPIAGYLVVTSPARVWLRTAAQSVAGAAPLVAIAGLYNLVVTGSATTFSIDGAERRLGRARFRRSQRGGRHAAHLLLDRRTRSPRSPRTCWPFRRGSRGATSSYQWRPTDSWCFVDRTRRSPG